MPEETISKLLTLQEKDKLVQALQTEAQTIPRRKKKLTSTLDAQRIAVENATESFQRLSTDIKDVEGDVELSREKIARYRKQQMEVKDNEAYRALDNEIRGLTGHIRKQEEGQIELMEELERAKAHLEEQKAELERQIKEVGGEEAKLEAKEAKILTELSAHQEDAVKLREGIDEDWLEIYSHIFKQKGDVALVTSNGNKCGGCNMQIPPALVLASKTGDEISRCNFCGRMLYYAVT